MESRALHSDVEYSSDYRPGGSNIELCIQMLTIVLDIDLEAQYRALQSVFESSAEYRPG